MRKHFIVMLFFSALLMWQCDKSPYPRLRMSDQERAVLDSVLTELESQYDPEENMLVSEFSSPGYHTTLTGGMVHRTRQSLTYAASCLDSGDPDLVQRGIDIIERVIQLQDQDPQSETYGIWPWFLEEPLSQMSPPDWNWADFCATQLLQTVIYHQDDYPAELLEQVNESIYHAARSIERRDVGPGYTNIAIMGTYVTMMTAELQALPELKEYAMNRLQRFYEYTFDNGAFREYNSPTYTVVALKELGRMRLHFPDADALRMVQKLYNLAWEEIALHFHVPTYQWAGPHARSYHTLLPQNTLAFLQANTSRGVSFQNVGAYYDLEAHRLDCPCPTDLQHYFVELPEPRNEVRTFDAGEQPLIGTTYLHPGFCLGTINRGDLWNQRRPLLAYWGDSESPSYLRLRFLHDGYDFAAMQFFSTQHEGATLFGVVPATDGGDTHINLDPLENGTFRARELRLRFEFGGRAADAPLRVPRTMRDNLLLPLPGLDVRISITYEAAPDFAPFWEGGKEKGTAYYDVVLYSGEERTFDLNSIDQFIVSGLVATGHRSHMGGSLDEILQHDLYRLSFQNLRLVVPVRPAPKGELHQTFVEHNR